MLLCTTLVKVDTRPNASGNKSSLLNVVYTNFLDKLHSLSLLPNSLSDHCPIISNWSLRTPKIKPAVFTLGPIPLNKLVSFDTEVVQIEWDTVYQCTEPAEALSAFYNILIPIQDRLFPMVTLFKKSLAAPWLTPEVKQLIKARDNAWKAMK